MNFHVYILQSELDGSFYVGYTSDIEGRLWEHNEGRTGYTMKKRPWRLRYTESYDTKSEAMIREKKIKARKSRAYIEQLIAKQTN